MGGDLDLPFLLIIMEDINQYVKNTYVIRRRLAELRRLPGESCFNYWVGKFRVRIWTERIQDTSKEYDDHYDSIVSNLLVDVSLYEEGRDAKGDKTENYIYLDRDSRFANYQAIQYKQYGNSDGREMPIQNLCELIRYLHIISKLSAFM